MVDRKRSPEPQFSKPFLLVWFLFPAAAFFSAFAGFASLSPLFAIGAASLLVAGVLFPIEMSRFETLSWPRLLSLPVFLAPFFLAAGRLTNSGWRAGAAFALLVLWVVLVFFSSTIAKKAKRDLVLPFLLLFAGVSFLLPWLNYLFRDLGSKQIPWLLSGSPFVLLQRLCDGKGYEKPALYSVLLLAALWLVTKKMNQEGESLR